MKQLVKTSKLSISLLFAVLLFSACQAPWDKKAPPKEQAKLLFVIHSGTAFFTTSESNPAQVQLTMNQVNNSVAYFTDRPSRSAGTQSMTDYLANWTKGANSFEQDSPNAAFVFYKTATSSATTTPEFKEINMTLTDPVYNASIDQLTFTVKIMGTVDHLPSGNLLEASLFIDQ